MANTLISFNSNQLRAALLLQLGVAAGVVVSMWILLGCAAAIVVDGLVNRT